MKHWSVERHDHVEVWTYRNPPMNYFVGPGAGELLELIARAEADAELRAIILTGDLDFCAASGFLQHAARVIDDQTERFVLDLAGVTFLDCAGARALAIATCFAPRGCPVVASNTAMR